MTCGDILKLTGQTSRSRGYIM